jgi:hypothetical protein
MSLRISVWSSKEIQATILALKGMEREIAKQVRAATKAMIQPEWQKAVAEHSNTRLEGRALVQTARASVSDQNVSLQSAAIGRKLSGGYTPSQLAHSAEFGADRSFRRSYEARSSKGKTYTVRNRRTRAQFAERNLKGRVVYPAAAQVIPRLASLWIQTTIRTFYELIERK